MAHRGEVNLETASNLVVFTSLYIKKGGRSETLLKLIQIYIIPFTLVRRIMASEIFEIGRYK